MKDLLLLHGALGSHYQFAPIEPLLDSHYHLHTLSFSGHGRTPSAHHAFTIQNLAHEVLDWLNARQQQHIDIFGYSMGGYVALWLARFYPDRIGRIFTFGTKLHWSEAEAAKETKLLNAYKIVEKVPAFARTLADRHGEHEWRSVMSQTAHLMHDLAHHHLTATDFALISSTVLLGLGDTDNMVTHEETMLVQGQIPNCTFLEIPSCPHPWEQVPHQTLAGHMRTFFG